MTNTLSVQEIKSKITKSFNSQATNRVKGKIASRVVTVINGYGKREGFFDNIGGIFYRIWNAVKAIFGQSDWQLARKECAKSWIEIAKARDSSNNTVNSSIPKKHRAKLHKLQKEYFLNIGNSLLSIIVDATHSKFRSTSELTESLNIKMGSPGRICATKLDKKIALTCPELSNRAAIVKALVG
jgi:hypothetical protein